MPPRIRTLKPDIWQDEAIGRCPIGARLLYVGMITQADDEGRLRAATPLLRSTVFPYDPKVTLGMVQGWLDALVMERRVRTYLVDGEVFADLPGWSKNQRINRPSPSVLPRFRSTSPGDPDSPESAPYAGDSVNAHGGLTEDSLTEGKGRDRKEPLSSWPGDDGEVLDAYLEEHPRAAATPSRRRLLQARRKEGFDQETLLAAIVGNHLDPFCNGENAGHKTYHGFELIFRDANHVEKYAALAAAGTNGKRQPTAEEQRRIEAAAAEFDRQRAEAPPIPEPEELSY